MRWEYYDENIVSKKRAVATLYTSENKIILDVYRGKDYHYTIPKVFFIKSFFVYYAIENKLAENDVLPTDTDEEILKKRLIAGCKEIEKNYLEQVEEIRGVIG